MAKLNKFTSVGVLAKFSPEYLVEFLGRYPDYLASRAVELSVPAGDEAFDYEAIIPLFAQMRDDTPYELLEAAFFIEQMASRSGRDKVVQEARARNIRLDYPPDLSVHDFILLTWLRHPALLEQAKSRLILKRQRAFALYPPLLGEVHPYSRSSMGTLPQLERRLAAVLPGSERGGVAVLEYDEGDEAWFLIRRGDFVERQGVLNASGSPGTIFFRPLRYDVVIYSKIHGELRVNADKSLHVEYRQEFGDFLFGRHDFFAKRDVFTLDILLQNDPSFLDCSGLPGLSSIRLTEVCYEFPGTLGIRRVDQATDLVQSNRARNTPLVPVGATIRYAKFDVQFEGSSERRSARVTTGNVATYSRESDSTALENWFRQAEILLSLNRQVRRAA